MSLIRHTALVAREFAAYAITNRAWWILPTVLVLAAIAVVTSAAHATVPYALYTLF